MSTAEVFLLATVLPRGFCIDDRARLSAAGFRFWHIASFRCGAEFGRYRGIADIGQARTNSARFMTPRPSVCLSPATFPNPAWICSSDPVRLGRARARRSASSASCAQASRSLACCLCSRSANLRMSALFPPSAMGGPFAAESNLLRQLRCLRVLVDLGLSQFRKHLFGLF